MHSVTIYGASDDLVEVEGDVREEFSAYEDGYRFLAFGDGSLVRLNYTDEGCWEVRVEVLGAGTAQSLDTHDGDTTTYTDRLTLTRSTPFRFCLFGRSRS